MYISNFEFHGFEFRMCHMSQLCCTGLPLKSVDQYGNIFELPYNPKTRKLEGSFAVIDASLAVHRKNSLQYIESNSPEDVYTWFKNVNYLIIDGEQRVEEWKAMVSTGRIHPDTTISMAPQFPSSIIDTVCLSKGYLRAKYYVQC